MTKVKIRFSYERTRDKFIEFLNSNLYYIIKSKYNNNISKSCSKECIYWFDLNIEETKELVYTNLQKAIEYYSAPYEIIYIKERKD